jgi:hypothetical protein
VVRASNEGLPRPRVLRARRAPGHSVSLFPIHFVGGQLVIEEPDRGALVVGVDVL